MQDGGEDRHQDLPLARPHPDQLALLHRQRAHDLFIAGTQTEDTSRYLADQRKDFDH